MTNPTPRNTDINRAELDDAPPFLGSWRNIHMGVALCLAVTVALLWWMTVGWA